MPLQDLIRRAQESLADTRALLHKLENQAQGGGQVDGSFYCAVAEAVFPEGTSQTYDLVFSVPTNAGLEVAGIGFYPQARYVTTDPSIAGPDERVFRPCIFSSAEGAFSGGIASDRACVDAAVELTEQVAERGGTAFSRPLQNYPTPIQFFFSDPVNYGCRNGADANSGSFRVGNFDFPAAYRFACPLILTPGSTVTARLSVFFASKYRTPEGSDAERYEYKIKGVLVGTKVGG